MSLSSSFSKKGNRWVWCFTRCWRRSWARSCTNCTQSVSTPFVRWAYIQYSSIWQTQYSNLIIISYQNTINQQKAQRQAPLLRQNTLGFGCGLHRPAHNQLNHTPTTLPPTLFKNTVKYLNCLFFNWQTKIWYF